MTTTKLSTLITEEGTAKITAAFTDESGSAVTPTSATWSLTTTDGTEINGRTDEVIGSLSTSVDIVLSGDDLEIGANGIERILTVQWVYDSSAGNDLPGNAELWFTLENLVNIP